VSAADGYAYIAGTGRTDGTYFAAAADAPSEVYPLGGRAYFWDPSSATLRQTDEAVRGTLFNDFNRNSSWDEGESPAAALRVYADLNQDGQRQTREPSTLTNSAGEYRLFDVPGATATVRVRPDDHHLDPGARKVTLGTAATVRNFAIRPAATVKGIAFTDMNQNGRQDDLNYASIDAMFDFWLDLDRDGVADANEPIATNTRDYQFGGLAPGSYVVRARPASNPPWPLAPDLVFTTPLQVEVRLDRGTRYRNFGFHTTQVITG
jgi:hypothetical protein